MIKRRENLEIDHPSENLGPIRNEVMILTRSARHDADLLGKEIRSRFECVLTLLTDSEEVFRRYDNCHARHKVHQMHKNELNECVYND